MIFNSDKYREMDMEMNAVAGSTEKRTRTWNSFLESPDGGFLCQIKVEDLYGDASMAKRPHLWPERRAERLDWIWRRYGRQLALADALDDLTIPNLNMLTGTEIFAEAFGCRIERPDHTMPFAMPLIDSAEQVSKLKVPKLGSCSLDFLFEMADDLYEKAGRQAVFRMIDLQSPMDIANLIWNKESLLIALYESPEAVKELASKVTELLCSFLDEWFRRYGSSFVAHFPDYYMERGLTLSVDEVGIVGPDVFEEFFLPELNLLSKRYGGLGIHCCADSRHQWLNFKKVQGLKVLNLVKPPSRGVDFIKDALQEFNGVCAQYHYGWTPEGPLEAWPEQFPKGAKVILDFDAKDLESAQELSGKLKKIFGKC